MAKAAHLPSCLCAQRLLGLDVPCLCPQALGPQDAPPPLLCLCTVSVTCSFPFWARAEGGLSSPPRGTAPKVGPQLDEKDMWERDAQERLFPAPFRSAL